MRIEIYILMFLITVNICFAYTVEDLIDKNNYISDKRNNTVVYNNLTTPVFNKTIIIPFTGRKTLSWYIELPESLQVNVGSSKTMAKVLNPFFQMVYSDVYDLNADYIVIGIRIYWIIALILLLILKRLWWDSIKEYLASDEIIEEVEYQ